MSTSDDEFRDPTAPPELPEPATQDGDDDTAGPADAPGIDDTQVVDAGATRAIPPPPGGYTPPTYAGPTYTTPSYDRPGYEQPTYASPFDPPPAAPPAAPEYPYGPPGAQRRPRTSRRPTSRRTSRRRTSRRPTSRRRTSRAGSRSVPPPRPTPTVRRRRSTARRSATRAPSC
ncbi:hypothetical protein G7075_12935 [Phycicoccus sp. HDW14]|uniref:hypothetical protein n=1 Tax=Phycicoccus sp. HDW14 TaxID=2714941 RepID=UPI0014093062|nr:hypothetical protein [Phycicoccus sp. HDW14]QIM21820.1 hypothetical protein G7075_12935 [Phycicoccus sp. HDW14]